MKCLYIFLAILAIGLVSCKKNFLSKDHPTATTDENWWQTEPQLLAAIGFVNNQIPSGTYQYAPNTRISFTGLTDDAVWTANFFGEINQFALGNGNASPPAEKLGVITNAIQPIWQADFERIRMANRILANADKAYADAATINRYKMEARALRAWYHLDLFLLYSEIPIVDRVVTPEESDLEKGSTTGIIQFITAELDSAAAVLPLTNATGQENRITKGAALTMKAVAFLNVRMYPEAAAAAKQVIDLNYYELYKSANPNDSYLNLFLYAGQNNKEWIIRNNAMGEAFYRLAPPNANGTSNVNPTASIVNEYETKQGKTIWELGPDSIDIYRRNPNYKDNRDPRLKSSIVYPGVTFHTLVDPFNTAASNPCRLGIINSSRTGYWVRKYTDLTDRTRPTAGTLSFMIYRYADVLLMYVEALVESGQWNHPDVVKYLNMIRHRAGMPDVNTAVYNSELKIRELYRRERRVELAFEGHRLFDIRRWKIGDKVMNGIVEGATNPATGAVVQVETRHFNPDRDYVWPIPAREIQGNPNMVQNIGY
jgi:hypothetical protein